VSAIAIPLSCGEYTREEAQADERLMREQNDERLRALVSLPARARYESSKVGDTFTATVLSDVRASDGSVAVPSGATVRGTVTAVDDSDDATDAAVIKLDFNQLTINGNNHPFEARIETTELQQQGDTRRETIEKAGIGAAAGAVLGAVLGDADLKNILTGAALGAAAGTAISLGAGDVEGTLPVGTVFTIQSTQQVSFR
jgi:hypothetical protein